MQEKAQRRAERLVGEEAHVVVAAPAALATDAVEEVSDRLLVRSAERPGFGEQLLVALDVAEDRRAVEGQLHLVAVEYLHYEHFMPEELEAVQAVVEGV